jgi:putative endonuclease
MVGYFCYMGCYVYILWSEGLKKFYIGQTSDLENRLREHNAGEGKFSKLGKPWKLVFHQLCATRSEAVMLEKRIKSRGAGRFLADQKT